MAAGDVGIDADEDPVSPVLFDALPECAGLAPVFERDLAAMFEILGKYSAGFFGHFLVRETDHQLVIDVEAALVEVGRANINNIIDDDQFRVEDLGWYSKMETSVFRKRR